MSQNDSLIYNGLSWSDNPVAFLLSVDSPSGTGDHENYFHRKERVLEVDGTKIFNNCRKIAAVVRERFTHIQWFASDLTFIFSDETKSTKKNANAVDTYTRVLSPDFGYVNHHRIEYIYKPISEYIVSIKNRQIKIKTNAKTWNAKIWK